MSRHLLAGLIFVTVAACGDNKASSTIDAPVSPPKDAAPDAVPDAPADANPSDEIAAVKMTADGTGLTLPISYAIVTYLKPQVTGAAATDPPGFTIQASQMGPAIFVAVDPATTTPALVRGDVIAFTVTDLVTTDGQKRVSGISGLTRISQGFDVTTLTQDVSAATDLVTALDTYDSELVDVTGTIGAFAFAGAGFQKAQLTTAGVTSTMLRVRVPATFPDSIDLVATCTITLKDTPVGRLNTETQLAAFTASDITLTGCPAPTVVSAVDASTTSVRITFSRNILAGSVMADGSQFTFDNGLTASAATVSGRTVTVTTSAQAVGTTYTVTVATSVTDLQGTPVAAPGTATFLGFEPAASVKINEVNTNIASSCDLIELRVIEGGTLRNIRVQERTGNTGNDELRQDLPSVTVAKNDIVVLHLNSGSATCNPPNPNPAVNETTSVTQQAAATFTRNYDTAWDLLSADNGLTVNDNVITVFDRFGVMQDVMFLDDDVAGSNVAAATETAAAAAAAAMMWEIVGGGTPPGGFVDDDFRNNAVIDSNAATTTSHTGANSDSMHRIDDTDDNDKADWAQGANTWGLINAGQSPIP